MTTTTLTPTDIKAQSQQFRASLRPLPDRPVDLADDAIDPTVKFGSDAERRFAQLWVEMFPTIDLYTQYVFHPKRRFSLDFYQPDAMVGIEVQGSIHTVGGHSTGTGIARDYEKARIAAEVGILIVSVAAGDVEERSVLESVAEVIRGRMS